MGWEAPLLGAVRLEGTFQIAKVTIEKMMKAEGGYQMRKRAELSIEWRDFFRMLHFVGVSFVQLRSALIEHHSPVSRSSSSRYYTFFPLSFDLGFAFSHFSFPFGLWPCSWWSAAHSHHYHCSSLAVFPLILIEYSRLGANREMGLALNSTGN